MPSASIKRQRQKRRVDEDGDPEFQVAPMVDVLLVLMLFFMAITSTEVLKKDPNLQLPEATHAKKPEDKNHNEIVVNVDWLREKPKYSIDGITYGSADDIQIVVATKFKQNPKAFVLVRADQNVEYSSISDIMAACAGAGVQTVSFAAITNPASMGTPAAGEGTHQ